MSTVLEAVTIILRDAAEPLHYREITRRIVERGLWVPGGKTPEATVNAQLSTAIKKHGDASGFRRVGKGIFVEVAAGSEPSKPDPRPSLSFNNAAEKILREQAGRSPMHYREITVRALESGLLHTEGRTPEATMYAQIIQEEQRRERRGEAARFVRHGKGMVGLAEWVPVGVRGRVAEQNKKIRRELLEHLQAVTPEEFEQLIGQLLVALGFEDVSVTRISSDGGIDVRGTLVVGDVIRTRMAVQAKKWKKGNNVQAPTVQQVRGSLGAHEQGLIITTSGFSKGASVEAQRLDAVPVGLMNGQQLTGLLIEHQIGVRREPMELLSLSDDWENIE